jgi:hypothetical protein
MGVRLRPSSSGSEIQKRMDTVAGPCAGQVEHDRIHHLPSRRPELTPARPASLSRS